MGKNATNYHCEVLAVCEATTHLLSSGLAPAKVVLFIDTQAAILALSINTPTALTQFSAELKLQSSSYVAGLLPYSAYQVILGFPSMKEPIKKSRRDPRNSGTVGPIPRYLKGAEAVARFRLATGHNFLGVYLHWLGVATNEACSIYAHVRRDGVHLLQCTGLVEYPADDIVSRYWEARRQMVKKPSTGVG
ncbi:reverse transcriptase [Trichonephila clavipes]|nr:reverse transcriptase [Trichonephila clavipes]